MRSTDNVLEAFVGVVRDHIIVGAEQARSVELETRGGGVVAEVDIAGGVVPITVATTVKNCRISAITQLQLDAVVQPQVARGFDVVGIRAQEARRVDAVERVRVSGGGGVARNADRVSAGKAGAGHGARGEFGGAMVVRGRREGGGLVSNIGPKVGMRRRGKRRGFARDVCPGVRV